MVSDSANCYNLYVFRRHIFNLGFVDYKMIKRVEDMTIDDMKVLFTVNIQLF